MNREFFHVDTLTAAERLIGCDLVRIIDGREVIVRITETEAYKGKDDPASHAYRGMTPRNQVMFGKPGRLYIYLSYGMHYCMNIVTEAEGVPGAVLIRGAVPLKGIDVIRERRNHAPDRQLLNGPGKLTQGLALDLSWNGYDLCAQQDGPLQIHPGVRLPFRRTKRIGISRATDYLWRFVADGDGSRSSV